MTHGFVRRNGSRTNVKADATDPRSHGPYARLALAFIALSAVLLCWAGFVRAQGCTSTQICNAPTCPIPCGYTLSGCKAVGGTCNCDNPPGTFNIDSVKLTNPQPGLFCKDATSGSCDNSGAPATCYTATYYYTPNGGACASIVCVKQVPQNTCNPQQS